MALTTLNVIPQLEPQHANAAAALKQTLASTIATLNGLKAWPEHPAGILIRIVNPGESKPDQPNFETHATDLRTEWTPSDGLGDAVISRMNGTPMEIAVSANLFVNEIGRSLVDLGASAADAAIFMLGHEIHHLDEVERQQACKIRIGWANSPFAGAARADLPPKWLAAIQSLSKSFPSRIDIRPDIAKAGDVANEAAADLTGLHWLRKAGRDWSTFSKVLIKYRASNVAQMKAKGLRSYEIIDALNECLIGGLPTPREIHERCWALAVQTLLAGPSIGCLTRSRLERLPPLPSAAAAPQSSRKLGR